MRRQTRGPMRGQAECGHSQCMITRSERAGSVELNQSAVTGSSGRAATVRNIDAWYEAFGVTPDQKLYLKPEDRVRAW
jgi:hypothetical protein